MTPVEEFTVDDEEEEEEEEEAVADEEDLEVNWLVRMLNFFPGIGSENVTRLGTTMFFQSVLFSILTMKSLTFEILLTSYECFPPPTFIFTAKSHAGSSMNDNVKREQSSDGP